MEQMILFIRHAETDMAGTFCGHSDPELNERGYAQLPALIEQVRGRDIGAVYTSDLRRAQTTASAIADAFRVDCHASSALREISFGDWEGLRWPEIERRDQAYAQRWLAEYPNLPAPLGESFTRFEERVLCGVESLSRKKADATIAVVTHAGVLRTILCRLQGYPACEARQKTKSYCCIIPHVNIASAALSNRQVS
jgi:alpha-ribazole phosphatase